MAWHNNSMLCTQKGACSWTTQFIAMGQARTARRPTNSSRRRVNADSARLVCGAFGSYLGVIFACASGETHLRLVRRKRVVDMETV